jgi:hypothetical protein
MVERVVREIGDEFRGAELGDERRNLRLVQLAESMAKSPETSFPKAMSDAELEAAYRFFSNVKVEPEEILRPHVEQTVARMSAEPETLVVHDSTTLSYDEHREGLVARGDTRQFLVHCSLALKADGSRQPLGVVALSRHLPIKTQAHLLQDRWGEHVQTVHGLGVNMASAVHLMDREADDYELFDLMVRMAARFVVRMYHDRDLGSESLRESLQRAQVSAEREIALKGRGKRDGSKQRQIHPPRNARIARLAIATHRVTIPRPKKARRASHESLSLNIVRVWEPEPPSGEKPVDWVLYTSEPIDTPERVLQVVDWYRARWTIEEYFKALKTGCAMEQRQLGDFHSLSNALALLAPIAWRLLLLRNDARDSPGAPATTVLDQDEIDVLRAAVVKRRRLPENPTVLDAMLSIASLGGHLKHNGWPGWQTLASGYETLSTLAEGWKLRRAVEDGFVPPFRDQ